MTATIPNHNQQADGGAPATAPTTAPDEVERVAANARKRAHLIDQICAIKVDTRVQHALCATAERLAGAKVTSKVVLLTGARTCKSVALKATVATPMLAPQERDRVIVCPGLYLVTPLNADGDRLGSEILRALAKAVSTATTPEMIGLRSVFVSHNDRENRKELARYLTKHRVSWLFVDQFERAADRVSGRSAITAYDLLAYLATDLGINIVFCGTAVVADYIEAHDRLRSMVCARHEARCLALHPIDELREFVSRYVDQLPEKMDGSELLGDDILLRLYIASDGVPERLISLLQRAALIAVERSHSKLSVYWHVAQAHSEISGEPLDDNNLFRTANPANRRPTGALPPLFAGHAGSTAPSTMSA